MKSSLTLVLAILLFVVLGCSLDKLTGKKDEVPTPVPESTAAPDSTPGTGEDTASTPAETASSGVSIDKFNKIELGMSYEDVKRIMGSDGNQTSMTKSGSYESMSYEWKGDKFARISTRFTNGALVYKSQSGLTPSQGTADLSLAKFNQVNIGMSYNETKDAIGSEGELSSISKIGNSVIATYRWRGPKYSSIIATFKDDKLQNKTQSNLN